MTPAGLDALFWVAVALCALAQLFIVKAVLFPAAPPAEGPAADGRAAGRLRAPSRPLEIAWVVLPAIALAWLALWAWQLRHPTSLTPDSAAPTARAVSAAPGAFA